MVRILGFGKNVQQLANMPGQSAETSGATPQSTSEGIAGQSTTTTGQPAAQSANETIIGSATGQPAAQSANDAIVKQLASPTTCQPTDDADASAAQSVNGATSIIGQLTSDTGLPRDAAAQLANETIVQARTTLAYAAIMGIWMWTRRSTGTVGQIAGGVGRLRIAAGQPTESIVQSPGTGGQSIHIADQSIANNVEQSADTEDPLIPIVNSPDTKIQPACEIMEEPTECMVDSAGQSAGGMGQPSTTMEQSVDTQEQPSEAPRQGPVRQLFGAWFPSMTGGKIAGGGGRLTDNNAGQPTVSIGKSPGTEGQSIDSENHSVATNVGQPAEVPDSTVDNEERPSTTIEQYVDTEGQPSEVSTQSTNTKGQSVPCFTLILGGFPFPCGNKRNIEELGKRMNDLKKVRFVMKLLLYETKKINDNDGSSEIKVRVNNLNKTISNAEIKPSVKKYAFGLIGIMITRKVPKTLKKLLEDAEKDGDPAASENSPVLLATKEFMDALWSEKISLIRVRGESLVLTTAELTQICTKAHEENLFDDLAIATVSNDQKSYLYKLQDDLAEMLSFEINQEEDVSKRADRLRKRLNRWGRVLIILEGVTVNINLKEVGIPVSERCRVVMTLPNQYPSGEKKAEDAEPQISDKQAVTFMEPNWVPKLEKNSIADRLVETCKEGEINKLVANVEVWIHSYKESVRTIYIKSTRNEVEEVVSNGADLLPHPNA